jgi:hypothetical protein
LNHFTVPFSFTFYSSRGGQPTGTFVGAVAELRQAGWSERAGIQLNDLSIDAGGSKSRLLNSVLRLFRKFVVLSTEYT